MAERGEYQPDFLISEITSFQGEKVCRESLFVILYRLKGQRQEVGDLPVNPLEAMPYGACRLSNRRPFQN